MMGSVSLRFAHRLLPLPFALVISGCDLDYLIEGNAPAACISAVVSAQRSDFTTQSGEPEEVLSLTLEGDRAPNGWVVLASARLASTVAWTRAQEVRYLVDGEERALGQALSENGAPEGGGPWLTFDWLPPSSSARRLSVEFRNTRDGYLASIQDLHLLAFALPDGADLHVLDAPEVKTITQPDESGRVYQTVGSLDVAPDAEGDYLVLLGLTGKESPGAASIGVRVVTPNASTWPMASTIDETHPYLAQPAEDWQAFAFVRTFASDGTAFRLDVQVDASASMGSQIGFVRGLAFREDAFASVRTVEDLEERAVADSGETIASTLDVRAGGDCHRLVVAQMVSLFSSGLRSASFLGTGASFHHLYAHTGAKLSYGSFADLPAEDATVTTIVSAPDPSVPLSVRDSVIVALEVPGIPSDGLSP